MLLRDHFMTRIDPENGDNYFNDLMSNVSRNSIAPMYSPYASLTTDNDTKLFEILCPGYDCTVISLETWISVPIVNDNYLQLTSPACNNTFYSPKSFDELVCQLYYGLFALP